MKAGLPTNVLAAGASYEVRAVSLLGAEVLATQVPLSGGSITLDSTSDTIESGTAAVPVWADGRVWIPGADPRHPLGRYGQQLVLTAVMTAGHLSASTPLGAFKIQDWGEDEGDVTVQIDGPLKSVQEARLTTPTAPRKDGTFVSELRRLMIPGIPLEVDAALTDRACPASFTWDEDRLSAIYDLVDAWPARMAPDGYGGMTIVPDLPSSTPTPVITFKDNADDGTLVSAPRSDSREGIYNHVVARAQSDEADAPIVQGEAKITSGPYSVNGPYGDVPRFYSSPALETVAQCESAAASLLTTSLLRSRTVTVTTPVDPRIELFDPVRVVRDGATMIGYVLALTIPLVKGDMSLTVGIISDSDNPTTPWSS